MDKMAEDSFRELLVLERARVTSEIERLLPEGVTRENLGYGNHMADDATEVFEQAKDLALLRHLQATLTQVNDALQKMERGTYGECERCHQAIDKDRLEVLPYARFCLDCQKHRE